MTSTRPTVSIVTPTYNRARLLRPTLRSLTEQSVPVEEFELILVDDGSTDETPEVVREFADKLRLRYHRMDRDEADIAAHGFNVARVRNTGARMAEAPVLAFLDCGTYAGPDYVLAHREVHERPRPGKAGHTVVGYTYGYNPVAHGKGSATLAGLLRTHSAAEVVDRIGDQPLGWDMRRRFFDLDLRTKVAPWLLFWTCNMSTLTEDFWAVGGFDESFRGWGHEDIELGYRLLAYGAQPVTTRKGWAMEWPSEDRSQSGVTTTASDRNIGRFLVKHRNPLVEICALRLTTDVLMTVDQFYGDLLDWTGQIRGTDVYEELEAARATVDHLDVARMAVFGCGAKIPSDWPQALLLDVDAEALAAASDGGRHGTIHGIGGRTELPEQSFDLVVITSRLAGL